MLDRGILVLLLPKLTRLVRSALVFAAGIGSHVLGAPVIFETFTDDPITAGRFVQQTLGTESTFIHNLFRGDLRAFLDVDSSTAFYLSQPFAPITERDKASFSAKFRVESYDGRASPTAFIGLASTRHVENFGDGLTMIITTKGGLLSVNASIDQGGLKVEGRPVTIELGLEYLSVLKYTPNTRQLGLAVYGGSDFASLIGESSAVLPPARSLSLDRLGIQNGGARVTDQSVGSITVVVDEIFMPWNGPVPISISDITVQEGDSGRTDATFTVTLSSAGEQEIQVDYATADGTALADADYVSSSGTLVFPAGVTSQTIKVPVLGDTIVEADETFQLQLSHPINATLNTLQATATILDNDLPIVTANHASVVEGNDGTTNLLFTIKLNVPSTKSVSLDYATADGSAVAPEDYTSKRGTLTFAPGVTTQTIAVTVNGDQMTEPDESFTLVLNNPVQGILSSNRATGTILNDDSPPVLSIEDASVVEGNAGLTTLGFVVRLSNASSEAITVNFATANGTAVTGSDFVAASGTLSLAPGTTMQTLPVSVMGDLIDESDELFSVSLSNPAHAVLRRSQAQGTILDDDATPAIAIENKSIIEGDNGTSTMVFAVRLSHPSSRVVSVEYATADGTATGGSDYTSRSGTLTFLPGVVNQVIPVSVYGDTANEPNEMFTVKLNNAVSGVIAAETAVGTIINDDGATLSIDDVAVKEGNSGTVNAIFTVRLSGVSSQVVSVGYGTGDETATAGSDYMGKSGALIFPAGVLSQTLVIEIKGDALDEPDETFLVNLTNPVNATLARSQAIGTILDDDPPGILIDDVSVKEGDGGPTTALFTVKLTSKGEESIRIEYATSNGTAIAEGDYASASGTLTFFPGVTTQTIEVKVFGDLINEADEVFYVSLANPIAGALVRSQARGMIINDDEPPGLTIDAVTVVEGDTGTQNAVFSVSLEGASSRSVTVGYATADQTAKAGLDYFSKSGTVFFPPGVSSQPIVIEVIGDVLDELDETFAVKLLNPAGAAISRATGIGTILDDDMPALSITDTAVQEGNLGATNAVFTITLSSSAKQEIRVDYSSSDGTALAESDYVRASGTLVFPAGVTSQTLSVLINGDIINEPDETFFVELTNPRLASVARNKAQATILNDDEFPGVNINDVKVIERDAGSVSAVFTVRLLAPSSQIVNVSYATADGTANAGSDYRNRSGTLSFSPEITSQSLTVQVNGDVLDENDETFLVNLSNAVNANLVRGQGIGTILDDDEPFTTISDITVQEGDSGRTDATFTVTLSSAGEQEIQVDYATADGTALADADYVSSSGTLVFPAGVTSQTIKVPVLGDTIVEADETFQLQLSHPINATLNTLQATATILDNDLPIVTANHASVVEGNDGTTNLLFTIKLNVPSTKSVSLDYATADGSAVAPEDYTSKRGTLTFAPGVTTQTIAVTVNGDQMTEPDESFTLVLNNPVQGILSSNRATGTILNDDSPPVLSIEDASVVEGNAGLTTLGFVVRLSNASSEAITVNFATANGTAVTGSDFVAASGTLSLAPGTTMQTLPVSVMGDLIDESDELFSVSLSNPAHAVLRRSQAQGTILDDDATPAIAIENKSIIEGDNGTSTMVFAVRLSHPSSRVVSVEYATADGTATGGSDYTSRSGTLTFLPGVVNQVIPVSVYGDTANEPNEMFTVKLNNAVSGVIAAETAVGTIINDDGATLSIDDVAVKEGNSGTVNAIFTVRLSGVSSQVVSVGYGTGDETATAGSDYMGKSGALIFPAGVLSQTLVIEIKGDALDEPDETFLVNLTNPVNATLARSQAIGTILDDDPPGILIDDITVNAAKGPVTAVFTVGLTSPSLDLVRVDYATANVSATAGSDFEARTGTLVFEAGLTKIQLSIAIKGNTLDERTETFFVNLFNPKNATLSDSQGVGTILNELPTNAPPIVTITIPEHGQIFRASDPISIRAIATDSDGSIQKVEFYAGSTKLSQSLTAPYVIQWENAPVGPHWLTAVATDDQGAFAWSLPVEILVAVLDCSETSVFVPMRSARDLGVSEINWPAVSISDAASIMEGNSGLTPAVFSLALSAARTNTTTVEYFTLDGTAEAASDYAQTNGIVTFLPGQTNAVIVVLVRGDKTPEADEAFRVQLLNPLDAFLNRCEAVGMILNDDQENTPPIISVIAGQTIQENSTTTAIPFVINDLETPAGRLIVTATSSNPALLPNDLDHNILLAGTSDNRTVMLRPTTGQIGSAKLTLTVLDAGGLTADTSFMLTVLRDAPALSVSIASPPNRSVFCPNTDIPIIAIVQSSRPVSKIEFFEGTTLLGIRTNSPFSLLLDKDKVTPGDYSLTAKVTDDLGNFARSLVVNIAVSDICGDVAIVRNFPDQEIDALSDYLFEIGLSARIFDQEGLTFEMLQPYRTIIWDDLGNSQEGLTDNEVAIFQRVQANGSALYLIGEQLASSASNLSVAMRPVWAELMHLRETTAAGCDGAIHVESTVDYNPITYGRFGTVEDFRVTPRPEAVEMIGKDLEVFGRCGARDVLVGYPGFEAMDTGQPRVFTQDIRVLTGDDGESIKQRKTLFQNVICWLHHCECSTFDVVLEAEASQAEQNVGDQLSYTVKVFHSGECEATGAVLTDFLPPGMTFLTADSQQGSWVYDSAKHALICNLGHLAKSSITPVTIIAKAVLGGNWTNMASIRVNGERPVSNNSASVITLVKGSATRLRIRSSTDRSLDLFLEGQDGRVYSIEASPDLRKWNTWRTNAPGPIWSESFQSSNSPQFFRARSP